MSGGAFYKMQQQQHLIDCVATWRLTDRHEAAALKAAAAAATLLLVNQQMPSGVGIMVALRKWPY